MMDPSILERRRDPRTQAYLPITLKTDAQDSERPAQLLDLSNGGAAVLLTAYDAPAIGQSLDLRFETPVGERGMETHSRCETGIVVNMATPERGVRRVGVRFLQRREIGSDLFDPINTLSNHRKSVTFAGKDRRWETARNFEKIRPLPVPNS